jgi:hypothetical protein
MGREKETMITALSRDRNVDAQEVVLKWVFGAAGHQDLATLDPRFSLAAVLRSGVEGHLLARLTHQTADVATPRYPDEFMAGLRGRCLQNAVRNLERDRQAREFCAALERNHLSVMLIKGTALRGRFPELSGRPQCDTDLLVRREDLARAEAVAESLGYHVDEKAMTRQQYLDEHFDLRMVRGGNAIELHWAMANESSAEAIDRVWNRATPFDWGGARVWLPSVQDQLVFHQVHICRHEFFHGLRWFADLYWEMDHARPEDIDLETVMDDWPRRFFIANAWVGGGMGRPLDDFGNVLAEAGSRLDRWMLRSLARRHLSGKDWGLPPWYYSPALGSWIRNESRSLALALMGTITRRLSRRVAHALRGGRAPAEA